MALAQMSQLQRRQIDKDGDGKVRPTPFLQLFAPIHDSHLEDSRSPHMHALPAASCLLVAVVRRARLKWHGELRRDDAIDRHGIYESACA